MQAVSIHSLCAGCEYPLSLCVQAVSILDKDVEAKAILELAGRKQHSEGLRDLTEDEPEMTAEMKRKMNTIPSHGFWHHHIQAIEKAIT